MAVPESVPDNMPYHSIFGYHVVWPLHVRATPSRRLVQAVPKLVMLVIDQQTMQLTL